MTNTTHNIRAIVIDPFTKSVYDHTMNAGEDGGYHELRRIIGCDIVQRVSLGGRVDAWIDDEGLLTDWDTQAFCKLVSPTDPEQSITLAGKVVLLSHNGRGDSISLPWMMTKELVERTVQWVEPKDARFPGTTFTTFGPDGSMRTEHVGPEWLTYDNH